MKKQFKALALALTLLTTTACGSSEAKVNDGVKAVKAEQTSTTNEAALSNVSAPKSNNVETVKKEVAEEKVAKKNYLIPQTLKLKEEEKANESQADTKQSDAVIEEVEEVANEIDETIEEVIEDKEIEESSEEDKQEEVAVEASNDEAKEVFVAPEKENFENQVYEETKIAAATVFEAEENEEAIEVAYSEDEIEPAIIEEEQVEEKVKTQVASASKTLEEPTQANEAEKADQKQEAEENNQAGGLTIASPSVNEVKSYWKNYQSKANDTADFYGINLINPESAEIFGSNTNLDLNNIELGALSKAAQEDALHIANTARFASGIKNELRFGADQAQYAQAATVVNRLNLQVSHSPSQPNGLDTNNFQLAAHGAANSNLASNFGLLESVVEYLKDDLGERNQTEVGHRRWVLNPAETTVGFGQTDDFTAMYVNNNQYDGENQDLVYAYPGQTAISEFHSADASLSLMFGENFDLSNAQVYVKDLATGEERNDANIDESFKGCAKAITFGQGMNFAPGTKLQVKVTGVTKNGVDYPVEYTIEYTSIR